MIIGWIETPLLLLPNFLTLNELIARPMCHKEQNPFKIWTVHLGGAVIPLSFGKQRTFCRSLQNP